MLDGLFLDYVVEGRLKTVCGGQRLKCQEEWGAIYSSNLLMAARGDGLA